jgi:hypothetical protein
MSGIFLAIKIRSIQLGQEQIEQLQLDFGKQQEETNQSIVNII